MIDNRSFLVPKVTAHRSILNGSATAPSSKKSHLKAALQIEAESRVLTRKGVVYTPVSQLVTRDIQ